MYRIALFRKKKFESAARQILKTLVRKATSAMFQKKKLKRIATSANATSAIAEVAEVVLCASN